MRLIIVCGEPECRKEYKTDTEERVWECPHCGRVRENDFYPFLSAKMMQARIDGDHADWETIYGEACAKAEVRLQERNLRLRRLERDLGIADDDAYPDESRRLASLVNEEGATDQREWRGRTEAFMREARAIIVGVEDRIKELEDMKEERRKARKGAKEEG